LTGLDTTVPIQTGSRIGIAAGDSGVPAAGNTITTCVLPGDIPAINGAGARIGDTNRSREAGIPLVADHIFTARRCGG